MKGKFSQLRSRCMLVLVSIGLFVGNQAWAQSEIVDKEKFIIVSKFAKFASWPEEANQATFTIGVYNDVEKFLYFSEAFKNKGVKGKDILVKLIKTSREASTVNILYMPSPNQRRAVNVATKLLKDSNTLIITEDIKDLTNTMVDLSYNNQSEKIDLKVVDENVVSAKITIPDLSFTRINEGEEILEVSPTFAQKNQQNNQLRSLQNQITQRNALLAELNQELQASEEKYDLALKQESERLEKAKQLESTKNKEIRAKDKKLKELNDRLQAQETQLNMSKQDLQLAAEEKIKEQEETVIELTEKLKQQNSTHNSTMAKLTSITAENKNLSNFQWLFFVFLVIATIALATTFIMWKKVKNIGTQYKLQPSDESNSLLPVREQQLIKSENFAALGYIATDTSYAAGLLLEELRDQLESSGDTKNATSLKPVMALLDNLNVIAADQDDTNVQSFDVVAYIQKIITLYHFEFEQSSIDYSYSGEQTLTLKSVPSYIALVLVNLINNALKHGFNNNGHGKIALKIEKNTKNGATITFFDDGKGMNKDTLAQVFKPFFTTASDRGYIGAGMNNTYELITNKLSGDISIDSKEGKGTTVTITLP